MREDESGARSNGAVEGSVIDAIAATCQLQPADVRSEMLIDDLGLGSMGLVAVISRLETLYELEITSEQVVFLLQAGQVGKFAEQMGGLIRDWHARR